MKIVYERNVQFLHYGVKGMKWGIRRYQNPDGSLTPLGRTRLGTKAVKTYNKAVKAEMQGKSAKSEKQMKKFEKIDKKLSNPKADQLAEQIEKQSFYSQSKSKDASKLSYDEISDRIGRLKTESEYKKLMKSRENPDVERGKEAAKQSAESIGKTTAIALGTSLAVYFGSRAISKAFGVKPPDYIKRDEFGDFKEYDYERQFSDMFKYAKPKK